VVAVLGAAQQYSMKKKTEWRLGDKPSSIPTTPSSVTIDFNIIYLLVVLLFLVLEFFSQCNTRMQAMLSIVFTIKKKY
jgi:Ca2+/Na+ antiporter